MIERPGYLHRNRGHRGAGSVGLSADELGHRAFDGRVEIELDLLVEASWIF